MARVPLNADDDDREESFDEGDVDDVVDEQPKKPSRKGPKRKTIPPPPAVKRRRWKRWVLLMLSLGGAVVFAPMIVAGTPARNYLLKVALPKFPGSMTIERAQLAWWRPPVLEGILVTGADGEDLLRIERISGSRAPWEIAREPSKLGTLRIEKPLVTLSTRPGTTNLEDALAPLSSGQRSRGRSEPFEYRIEILEGRVEIVSDEISERATIDGITVTVDSSSDPETGLTIRADAGIPNDAAPAGRLRVDATLAADTQNDENKPASTTAGPIPTLSLESKSGRRPTMLRGTAQLDGIRLDSLRPLWKRIEKTMELGGTLTADLRFRGTMTDGPNGVRVGAGGTAGIEQFRCQADTWLRGDRLRLARVRWSGAVEMDENAFFADRVVVSADPARIAADGTFPRLQMTDAASWQQLGKTLSSENYTLKAEADLAKLAALVPNALRLRDDVEITAGTLQVDLRSHEVNGERVTSADLQTTDLAGRTPQGSFVWREPLQGALTARMATDGPIVERLACRASFLEASGQGTLRNARLLAKCDLSRFTADAGRVLDLRDFQLGGRVTLDADCLQDDENRLTAKGRLFLDDFVWAAPGRDALREKQLQVEFHAAAAMRDGSETKVLSANLKMTGASDELTVDLVRPVMLEEVRDDKGDVPLRIAINGPLALWHQRLMPWVGLEAWRLEGDADLSTNVLWNPAETRISQLQGTVRNLQLLSDSLQVREPWVQLTGDVGWNSVEGRLTADQLVVNGSSVSLQADEFALTLPGAAPAAVVGNLTFRGDLERLTAVRPTAVAAGRAAPPAMRLRGIVSGKIRATQTGDVSTADGEVRIENCVLVPAASPGAVGIGATATATPSSDEVALGDVTIVGTGEFRQQEDSLTLKSLRVDSTPLRLDARGTVTMLSVEPWADLSGTAEYDWQSLQGWITQAAGSGLKLTGRQSDAFTYRGPLSGAVASPAKGLAATNVSFGAFADRGEASEGGQPRGVSAWDKAVGQAKSGWDTAEIYGLAAGRAQTTLRLADGVARMEGLDVEMAGGRITAAPFVVLNDGPPTLQHTKGRIAENVRFTPEMCRQWVKYVAPLLADATEIDGRFTLDLNGARVPVSAPKTGDVGGVLIVPQADVRPGPFADQVLRSARQIEVLLKRRAADRVNKSSESVLTLQNQNVEFRMVDGRVHHRGLEILIGEDLIVRTHGSVGFDDTIDVVAEIPVQEEWIRRDKLLASLQGQTLQIPIRGTLTRPQVDPRVLEDLTKRLATGSITKGIEGELSNQLDRLFRRGK